MGVIFKILDRVWMFWALNMSLEICHSKSVTRNNFIKTLPMNILKRKIKLKLFIIIYKSIEWLNNNVRNVPRFCPLYNQISQGGITTAANIKMFFQLYVPLY